MNKIYKVVWNKARNCYVVVAETVKNRTKAGSTRKLLAVLMATGVMTTVGFSSVNATGAVSTDTKENVKSDNAIIQFDEHWLFGSTEDAISIAIGRNAYAFNQAGSKAYAGKLGASKYTGAIAIGNETSALTGGVSLGNKVYTGSIGNVAIGKKINHEGKIDDNGWGIYDTTDTSGVGSTTLGSNSWSGGTFSTVVGSYSIATTDYVQYGGKREHPFQNFGSLSVGSFNSIESYNTASDYSGIANSVVGLANRTYNSNGSLIFGAGNEIKNSIATVATNQGISATDQQNNLMTSIANAKGGGAVLAIGGGNTIDGSIRSQVIGVKNTLIGNLYHKDGGGLTSDVDVNEYSAQYNVVDGYNNNVANVNHAYVIGANNNIQGKRFSDATKDGVLSENDRKKAQEDDNLIVIGDNHTLANDVSNNIILGTADKMLTTSVSNVVMIGHNANATVDGGVALGAGSVASVDKNVIGYDPATKKLSTVDSFIWKSTAAAVSVGDASKNITRQITNLAAGTNDTDAVNVAQLKKALESIDVDAGTGIKVDKIIKDGKTTYKISTNINGYTTATDITTVTSPNQTDTGNTDTSHTVTSEGTNTGSTNTSQGTTESTKTGETVTVKTETNPTFFGADDNQKAEVKPSGTLNINGDKQNISTSVYGNNSIKVELKKDITVDSVTANSIKVGDTSISTDGLTIQGGPSVTKDGINGGNQTITGVAAGDISATSTDAVNGSQLFATNQQVAQNAQSINKLGNRVNKVGAGAAALAALHPLDFDPDAKWDFAAGYGNYNGENAAAIGAYYRPNEDTMFSVGGSFGNGENMVNAGVSFKLGSGSSHVSTSRVAMAKEIKELRGELEAMKSAMLDANAGKKIDTSKLQLFPDVPQNHWAYEYVAQLAGNGMIEGYPDGNFAGDRPMTRYEFAAILYRAMTKGAVLSDKILSEFSHELEYFTVDTIAKDKAGNPTIQRVRTVKANTNK